MTRQLVVGFTGTQRGMTADQVASVHRMLTDLDLRVRPPEGLPPHLTQLLGESAWDCIVGQHGWCVGADDQFDVVLRMLSNFSHMVMWPAKGLEHKRGRAVPTEQDAVMPEAPPLERNRNITYSDFLIAAPFQDHMVQRSGTWTTVRYALASRKPVLVILPNGVVKQWAI